MHLPRVTTRRAPVWPKMAKDNILVLGRFSSFTVNHINTHYRGRFSGKAEAGTKMNASPLFGVRITVCFPANCRLKFLLTFNYYSSHTLSFSYPQLIHVKIPTLTQTNKKPLIWKIARHGSLTALRQACAMPDTYIFMSKYCLVNHDESEHKALLLQSH